MLIRKKLPIGKRAVALVARFLLGIWRALTGRRVFLTTLLLLFITDNFLYLNLGLDFEVGSPFLTNFYWVAIGYFLLVTGKFLLPRLARINNSNVLLLLFAPAIALMFVDYNQAGRFFYRKLFLYFIIAEGTLLLLLCLIFLVRRILLRFFRQSCFNPIRRRLNRRNVLILTLIILLIAAGFEIYRLETKLSRIENRLGGSANLGCSEKESVTKIRQSVVRIIGGESEGSGFSVGDDGLIITNFHVIEFEPSPKIVMPDNTFRTGEILMADKNADLAIIKIDRTLPPVVWGDPDNLAPAEEILAVGFPLGGALSGEASVSKGSLSGKRRSRDVGVDYLQVDFTLNPGISGGPMINICGEVVGINTAGLSGLGLGISANSVKQKWLEMAASKDSLKDIEKIEFLPDASPLEAVRAFYNYLKARKLEKAFELLSENFRAGFDFNHWRKGYEPLLDTTVIKIEEDPKVGNRIRVKLATKDFVEGEIVYQYFEGYWDVRRIDGKLRLWGASIETVEDPGFFWYYE